MYSAIECGIFRFSHSFTTITHSFYFNSLSSTPRQFFTSLTQNLSTKGQISRYSIGKFTERFSYNSRRSSNSSILVHRTVVPFSIESLGHISKRNFSSTSNSGKLDVNSKTMTEIPTWAHHLFRYKEYVELELFSLSEMTNGTSGHLFNDTLAKNPDYSMRMFLNTSEELLDSKEDATPTPETLSKRDILKLLSNGELRTTKTQLLAVVNVGKDCCGHAGVWHGGVISAVMDNLFGLMGNVILPVAATKSLNIQFRAPILVGSTVVAVTEFDPQGQDLGGRITAQGSIFDKSNKEVVKGSSELVDVSGKWKT